LSPDAALRSVQLLYRGYADLSRIPHTQRRAAQGQAIGATPIETNIAEIKQLKWIADRATHMPQYRVYLMDEYDQFCGAIRFDCSDEQAAKERAILLAGDYNGELWQLIAPFDSFRELKP
jgi:hypothetical protein